MGAKFSRARLARGFREWVSGKRIGMDADAHADRARALILLRATLITVADRLDQNSLEDLGLLTRMSELGDLVDDDLQRLAESRERAKAPSATTA
jgi:hypothetical protein